MTSALDLTNPNQFRLAVQNIHNVYNATPARVREASTHWYDKVNEATAKGVRHRGLTEWQGAGMVAAVSPNMDWERRNIDAFKELSGIKQADWDVIHASAASGGRTPEARDVLKGKSIYSATDANLVKAHRIMRGEDVEAVLRRRTAPKTNSFAHNIHEPDTGGGFVTVDGRAHDVAINAMGGWNKPSRGISSAVLPSGKKTKYEHFEDAYRSAAGLVGLEPHQMQAVVWEGGKLIERSAPSKSGRPRKLGVKREGQPYV